MKKILTILPLLAAMSLDATVERKMDEKNPIEVSFSRSSHNRIRVDGSSVERVMGDSALFSVTLDSITGQAFINVLKEITKPVTLTVITGSGFVQDLQVTSKEGPSEQIILKDIDSWEELGMGEIQGAVSVDLLNKILEGEIPCGYGKRPFEAGEVSLSLPEPLQTEPLKALEGALDVLCVYKIKNMGKQGIVLKAEALKNENNLWVFLNVQELGHDQEAVCVVAYPKK